MAESFPKQTSGGLVTVVTAGTRVQFPALTFATDQVLLEADPRGTAKIAIGGSGIVMATDTQVYTILTPGGSVVVPLPDVRGAGIWIDADANGAKLFYWAFT